MNPWLAHVKAYQQKHKCTYKEAMKGAKATYKKQKGGFFKGTIGNLAMQSAVNSYANTAVNRAIRI